MSAISNSYTSTGAKFFYHQEAMGKLRNKQGQPIVTHVMLTDVCNHTCAFCSVQHRAGESLRLEEVLLYLSTLKRYGLKSVILSGGGNPILYKDKVTGQNFNNAVDGIKSMGLEIGLITNGMPLVNFPWVGDNFSGSRKTWKLVDPLTLDKCTWIRISLAGLDHKEREVYVPDIDHNKTALGFSYVAHDIYDAPEDKAHGKVSTKKDLLQLGAMDAENRVWRFEDRIKVLTAQFIHYCKRYRPRYLRILPNCLEPHLIEERCKLLNEIADDVNFACKREVAFVQYKPPAAPRACYLGYIHPVLNCDGYVYPCDSCVLNETADHKFANPWRVCRWDEIASIYDAPVRSLIKDPAKLCPGCVFTRSNEILADVVELGVATPMPSPVPEHANFV